MQLRVAYSVSISRDQGYSVSLGFKELSPFHIEIDNVAVQITPDFGRTVLLNWRSLFPGQLPIGDHPSMPESHKVEAELYGLRAEIISDDVPELPQGIGRRFRQIAFSALQRVLVHFRNVTDDPLIDIYLATLRLEEYEVYDSQGSLVEAGDSEVELTTSDHVVTVDDWQEAIDRARTNELVPLQRELLLSARAFWHERNFNMALLNAAIACEMLLDRLLYSRLVLTRKVSPQYLENASNRARVDLLLEYTVVMDEARGKIDNIKKTFKLRNDIVHWSQESPVDTKAAEEAITSAQYLEFLLVS